MALDDADNLADQIAENALAPRQTTIDGQTVVEHSLPDQIAAAKYLAGRNAGTKARAGVRFTRIIPPGAG